MKRTINILLIIAVILPIVLLFWPFVEWNDVVNLILRVVLSVALQALFCITFKTNFIKVIPAMLTGGIAILGTYLFFLSPHWSNATARGLIADYVSPFICSVVVLVLFVVIKTKKLTDI